MGTTSSTPDADRGRPAQVREGPSALLPGLLLAGAAAALALAVDAGLAGTVGSPGAPVVALLVGTAVSTVRAPGPRARPGLGWAGTRLLQAGIVLLGLTVPLAALTEAGPRALPVVAVAVLTSFAAATVIGRLLGVDRDLRLLLGAGTGVCGASAIAATAGVLRPRPADVGYALSTVVLMNLVALAALPALARTAGLSDEAFGAWAGAAVNDTSAVVAVAGAWSPAALAVAVVVKLARVLALVPVTLVLAWRTGPRGAVDAGPDGTGSTTGRLPRWVRLVPPFLALFVLAVAVAATGLLPAVVADSAGTAVGLLLTGALAAVGLSTRLRDVASAGAAPVVLGALVWACVAGASLLTLRLVGLG